MPDSIKPLPIKIVTRESSPPPSTARNWGGFTKMGLGDVKSVAWGGATRRGLGQRVVAGSLTTRKSAIARFEPADRVALLDEIWANFPWWWASVILASTFAFALGAVLAVLIPR